VRRTELGTAEDVDQLEAPGPLHGVGERGEGRDTRDIALVRVDRDAIEPRRDQ
jgi:hypothetical protein